MVAHFLGNIQKKIVVHHNADADKQSNIKTIALKDFVNAAAFHVNGAGKPGNTTALGLEFPFDHVAEMNWLSVHFVSENLNIDTKIVFFTIIQAISKKYF